MAEEIARRAALAVDHARLYREAKEAVNVRDEFLSVASHELRTPLTSLELQVSNLQRVVNQADPNLEQAQAKIKIVDRQVARLNGLIERLLDVSRIAAGRLALDLEETDLRAVLDEVLARMQEQIHGSQSEVRVVGPERCVGSWDAFRLDQVMTNIISNAVKYGRGTPIRIELSERPEGVVFSVKDGGIGIPAEAQARIFERFERAVNQRNFGGLGLGLWISKQIISAMGGTVRVSSQPEQGAEFVVSLPWRPVEGAAGSR
jgi:signal transduction histidine kinase